MYRADLVRNELGTSDPGVRLLDEIATIAA